METNDSTFLSDEPTLKANPNDLLPHWLILTVMLMTLVVYLVICHEFGHELQEPLPEEKRIVVRTVLYAIAIVTFPLTNLIRHILLRLNQTMPGEKSAKSRYLATIIASMVLVESIGVLGFIMFMLGDDFNTLYIFIGLSVLGLYLYRPKEEEYHLIVNSLNNEKEF